jgi:NTP pyrophosphatase (non-canonical NTP hydrolase)
MPAPKQSSTSLEELNQLIWEHLEARDWHQASPRGLAVSLSLEANELLEHYQWRDAPVGSKEELAAELADILIYAFQFAQSQQIDIESAIRGKLKKAAQKYPAAKFKGKAANDMLKEWVDTKIQHRNHKKGL